MPNQCFFPSCTWLGEEERRSERQRSGRVVFFWQFLTAVVLGNGALSHLGGLPSTLGLVQVECGPLWSSQGPEIPVFLPTWTRVAQSVTQGHKWSQTRTAMATGTVTTRVPTVHTAELGCPEGLTPRPTSSSEPRPARLWQKVAQRGWVHCPGHTVPNARARVPRRPDRSIAPLCTPYLGSKGCLGRSLSPHRDSVVKGQSLAPVH